MMTPSEESQFNKLVSAACDGKLDPADLRRLEQLLDAHPEARREWLAQCRLHLELRLHAKAGAIARRVSDQITGASAPAAGSAGSAVRPAATLGSGARARREGRVTRRRPLAAFAVAAVGLAASVAACLYILSEPPAGSVVAAAPRGDADATPRRLPKRRPEVVAVMHRGGLPLPAHGEAPPSGRALAGERVERVLLAGEEIAVDEGRARLEMTSGASLYVEAPARLLLVSPDHVRLMQGSLSAHLSEWAKGFIVDTKAMRLVDLGTTFAVTAESATVAEAQVLKGLVKVEPRDHDNRSLRSFVLNEGESVRVDGATTTRRRVDLDTDQMRERIEALARLDSYQAIPAYNTGAWLQEGEEDPNWRIVGADESAGLSTPRYAVVCAPHRRYSINEPTRSQWVSVDRDNTPLPADSVYTFATTIRLDGYDLPSVRLIGQVLADNGVREVRLNGARVDLSAWIDNSHLQEFGREEFHVIEISSGFREGENVIEFDVWNGGEYHSKERIESVPNPMALRVEWQAFGRPLGSS